jgi:antitoxin ParD1/3/4
METPSVTRMEISLPKSLHAFIEEQIASSRYGTISEYLQALVQRELTLKAEQRLEALLIEGLESGRASVMTDADWDEMRQKYDERHTDSGER